MSEHKRKKLLWAILIGLILGALVGVIFAFIDKRTNTLMTKEQIEAYGWFYFNIVHMG